MNLYNFKYFVDSARLGSMTAAAELNHISRPAISHGIRNLEVELGVALIVHKRRSFELTQKGKLLLARSGGFLLQLEELKRELKSSREQFSGTLRIGCARTLATFMLPKTLMKMRKKFGEVNFKIIIANSEQLVEKLERREIDIALFLGDDSLHGYSEVVIDRGSFVLIKPSSHQHHDIAYAMTERRPETERAKALFKRKFHEELVTFAEIPSWDAIWYWTTSGQCGGLVPSFLIGRGERKEKISVVIPKVFPYEIKAVFPKLKEPDAVIDYFIQNLDATEWSRV